MAKEQPEEVLRVRQKMFDSFRSVPESGTEVEYLGKKFIVYKDVFWPSYDSVALVKNFRIKPGEDVLDLCTGSGVIAVFAAYGGVGKVVAVDVSPNAVKSAKENARKHGFSDIIDVRLSDMFTAIGDDEKFDVITMNPPFTDSPAKDFAEKTMHDAGLRCYKELFKNAARHLKPNCRIYVTNANFSTISEMKELANTSGFTVKQIGENDLHDGFRIFYAYEIRRKSTSQSSS